MVQLPKYVALKSKYNNNYLRYVNEVCSPVKTFLQYSGDQILSPYTKFELEQAECDSSLFNIRCCYNNKYWVSWPSDHHFIVAGADKKQEDKSKWDCTLFQPIYDNDHQSFRFRHVYLGFNLVLWRVGAPYGGCLRAQWSVPDRDLCDLSTVINWDSLLQLPKYVAFKCDVGTYLGARLIDCRPYLQFASNNIEDNTIEMETFVTKDGKIRIKSNHFEKFWRRDGTSNWILADSSETNTQDIDTLFWATKLVDSTSSTIALRNLGNENFVKRYTLGSKTSCLNAATKEIDQYSRLQMKELVVSREINNVNFRPCDARIDYDVVVLATGTATNKTVVPISVELNLSYTDTKSSTWASSISMKLSDVKTTINTGVPIIVDGHIEIPTKFSGEYKWGETKTTSNTVEIAYQVIVPPMSIIVVDLLANKGKCDVPFSYKQSDLLVGGKSIAYSMDDGVYHGTNYYNLSYEVKIKPICA